MFEQESVFLSVLLYTLVEMKNASYTSLYNCFPNNSWFLRVCIRGLLKTQWEKEKLLVMSNFSFSHSVSTLFQKFLPFPSNLKLSSAKSSRV